MKPLILSLVLGASLSGYSQAAEAQPVPATEIGSKFLVIGKLGKPLGTVVKVNCQVMVAAKPGSNIVPCKFIDVDGKPLGKDLILAISVPKAMDPTAFKPNDKLTLRGYEGGAFVGTPDDARGDLKEAASNLPWQFQTLFYVTAKVAESGEAK